MTGADTEEDALIRQLVDLAHPAGRDATFAAAIVRTGRVVSIETNAVLTSVDPTAHAEVQAIRTACRRLSTLDLTGATLYTSCEPCLMCLGAIAWAGITDVAYVDGIETATEFGVFELFPEGSYHAELLPVRLRKLAASDAHR